MMTRLIFVILLMTTLVGQNFARQHWRNGLLQEDTNADTLYDSSAVKACSTGINVCLGCKTYRICAGQPNVEDNPQEMCPNESPYCQTETGECGSTPDNSLAACGPEPPNPSPGPMPPAFKCTGAGKFPDPHNCAKYFNCIAAGIDGDPYECPPSHSYNATSQLCQQMDSGCQPIDCSESEYVFNEYPTDPQYFYYCKLAPSGGPATDSLPSIYLFSCGKGARFDPCSEQCIFECTAEGLFAKLTDPNKYYQCYKENDALKYVERSCPTRNQVFDESVQFCVYQM